MPTHAVYKKGKLHGYQWGKSGKVYPVSKHGKEGAKKKANEQGQAIRVSGYKG